MKTASFLSEMIQALLPNTSQLPDKRLLFAFSDDHAFSLKQAKMMNDDIVFESG